MKSSMETSMRKEYKEKKLAPSILAADFNRLGEQLAILKEQSIDVLHLDVICSVDFLWNACYCFSSKRDGFFL